MFKTLITFLLCLSYSLTAIAESNWSFLARSRGGKIEMYVTGEVLRLNNNIVVMSHLTNDVQTKNSSIIVNNYDCETGMSKGFSLIKFEGPMGTGKMLSSILFDPNNPSHWGAGNWTTITPRTMSAILWEEACDKPFSIK